LAYWKKIEELKQKDGQFRTIEVARFKKGSFSLWDPRIHFGLAKGSFQPVKKWDVAVICMANFLVDKAPLHKWMQQNLKYNNDPFKQAEVNQDTITCPLCRQTSLQKWNHRY